MLRKRAAICAVVLAVSTGTLGSTAAQAASLTPSTTNPSVEAAFRASVGSTFLDNQQRLEQFKAWIKSHDGWARDGYIDQINHASNLSTTLLWSGTDPLQQAALTEAKAMGITATIEQRPYTLPQIVAAENTIEANKSALAAAGFSLTGIVGVQADSSAIEIDGNYLAATKKTAALFAQTKSSVTDLVSGLSDIPASVVSGVTTTDDALKATPQDEPTVATRQTDTDPHAAGALMISSGGEICSTGFSLVVGGTRAYTTTARHCDPYAADWEPFGGEGDSFGSAQEDSPDGAATLLNGEGTDLAYDGAWNNAAGYSKLVVNTFDPSLNDYLCTGGGNSGEHCDVVVTSLAYADNDGTGNGNVLSYLGTEIDSGAIAAMQGDSGGPIISLYGTSAPDSEVDAAGMIQAGYYDSTHPMMTGSECGDVAYADSTTQCGQIVVFTTVDQIVDNWSNVTVDVN